MTVTFRPLARDDLDLIHEWLGREHVARWWAGEPTREEVAEEFAEFFEGRTGSRAFIAYADGVPIGYIQSYVAMESGDGWWPDETDPGVRGIDLFLADESRLGAGHGTEMVRSFVRSLFDDPTVSAVQVDPSPENARAIRCYEKAGFRRIAVIDTPDGPALLMRQDRHDSPLARIPA